MVLTALAVAYAAQVIPYTLAKPFWHDEIYTVLLARLPSLADTWRASADGADLSPPLNLWLTRGAHALAGVGLISTRAPALLGFFVALLTVFAVLRRRAGITAAMSGALALFFTAGLRYAAEARAYGVMMGLTGITFYAWTEAAAGRRRWLHVPLLGVALGASIWNHYFGILVFVPIIAGEAVRVVLRRRFDLPIVIVIVGALISALPLYPLVVVASQHRASFWAPSSNAGPITESYRVLLAPMLETSFLAIVLVVGAFTLGAAIMRRSKPGEIRRVPIHEAVALSAGVAIPIFGFVLGWAIAGVLVPRYLLSAVVPIGIALPLVLWRVNTAKGPAELVACALLVAFVAAGFVRPNPPRFQDPVADRALLLTSLKTPAPTVVASSLRYLQFWYYTPVELRGRMVYLVDPPEALRRSGSDTIDRGYIALSRWTAVAIEPYESFVARHSTFRVYEAGSGWLLAKLEASGASIEEIGRDPGGRLLQVTLSR